MRKGASERRGCGFSVFFSSADVLLFNEKLTEFLSSILCTCIMYLPLAVDWWSGMGGSIVVGGGFYMLLSV